MVGTETFAIRRQGREYMAVGRITVEAGAGSLRAVEMGLRCDEAFLPRRYELRALEGPHTNVVASRSGNRLRLTTSTEEGERLTEFLAGPDVLLLERGVAHHYYFLFRRLSGRQAAPGVALETLVPTAGKQEPLRIRRVAADSVRVGDTGVPATRYDLLIGEESSSVWIGSADGRVLRVEDPGRRWSATRLPKE